MDRPKLIEGDIDLSKVKEVCEEAMERLELSGDEPKDIENYVYEAIMEALYGPDVWEWINDKLE